MSAAQFDLGFIQANGDGSFSFTLDPCAACQMPQPNEFTVPGIASDTGGLGGICFVPGMDALCRQLQQAPALSLYYLVPSEGTVNFAFPDGNTIVGEMFLAGYGIDNPNNRGTYYGRFSGTLQGQGQCQSATQPCVRLCIFLFRRRRPTTLFWRSITYRGDLLADAPGFRSEHCLGRLGQA